MHCSIMQICLDEVLGLSVAAHAMFEANLDRDTPICWHADQCRQLAAGLADPADENSSARARRGMRRSYDKPVS